MKFARNALSTAATQVARTFLGLALAVLLARWLSEPDRGLYAVVATFALFVDQLGQVGMRLAVIYRMSRPGASRARAVGAALALSLAWYAALVALALLGSDWLRAQFLLDAPAAFLVAALVLGGADLFSGLSDAVARGIDRFDLRNANQIAIAVVSLVAVWVALVALDGGLLAALALLAAARVVLTLGFAVPVLRRSGVDLRLDAHEVDLTLRFGLKGHAQTLLAKLHERADVLIMAFLRVDPAQIAVYAVAVSVIDRLRVVPDSISSALLPKLTTLDPAETAAYTARVTRHLIFWVVVSAVALAAVAPFLVPLLFGRPYAASVLPLYVLLPATALLTVRTIVSNYFVAAGEPGWNALRLAAAVALNVALCFAAIPRFGILGAAGASLVSYGFEAIVTVLAFRRSTRRGLRETLLVAPGDVQPYLAHARRLRARFARGQA